MARIVATVTVNLELPDSYDNQDGVDWTQWTESYARRVIQLGHERAEDESDGGDDVLLNNLLEEADPMSQDEIPVFDLSDITTIISRGM